MIPSKKQMSIIGVKLLVLNTLLWFFVIFILWARYYDYAYFISAILFALVYGLAGIYYGFAWPNLSWRWGIWLSMPLLIVIAGIIILIISERVQFTSPGVLILLIPYVIMMFFSSIGAHANIEIFPSIGLILFIPYLFGAVSSSIGAYCGASIFRNADTYWVRGIIALGVGSILAIVIPPFDYPIGLVYFFIALIFGKYWPEFSWRWGILITLSSLMYLITYILVKSNHSYINKVDSQGILISGLFCVILACIGAYIGAYRRNTSS